MDCPVETGEHNVCITSERSVAITSAVIIEKLYRRAGFPPLWVYLIIRDLGMLSV